MVAVVLLALFVGRYWYAAGTEHQPELGISFSCRQARYLGEDCTTVYRALLDAGVHHVRLSLYWSDIERRPGEFDFTETDALLHDASAYGADVLLSLGIKAQRFPEVYVPDWLFDASRAPEGAVLDQLPGVRDAALRFDAAAIDHFGGQRAIIGWQVENEPFIKNFDKIHGWTVSPRMTAAEVALVHSRDPARRPVVVTHSSWTVYDQSWKRALALGDILGQNVFTKKAWIRDWWYFFPYQMGPFVPNLPGQAAAAGRAGKQLWITELQAEPEERHALTELRPAEVKSISPRLLRENVALARRSGASRVYLWGAEWWYATRGEGSGNDLWAAAIKLLS
ncbi:MAG: beta-galactosidase, partial [Dehalococcoidia bacterium]